MGYLQRMPALHLILIDCLAQSLITARLPLPLYLSMVEESKRLPSGQSRVGAAEGVLAVRANGRSAAHTALIIQYGK
jgi:hypothetical protein